MKLFTKSFLLLCALNVSFSQAAVKTSIVDGNWDDPSTWSPSGTPFGEDTLIINNKINASADIDVWINMLIVNEDGSFTSTESFALHGDLRNEGSITTDVFGIGDGISTINNGTINATTLATSNDEFINNGLITTTTFAVSNPIFNNYATITTASLNTSDEFNNYYAIYCSGSINTSDNFHNYAAASIVTNDLITSDTFINDGDVKTGSWIHGDGIVTGENGKFCISGCFTNAATISGTIDICDSSPGEFCDINAGTIDGSITYCESSPCQESLFINEPTKSELNFEVYPNPSSQYIQVEVAHKGNYTLKLYSLTGELLLIENNLQNTITSLDISALSPGQYILVCLNKNVTNQIKIVVE